jgi:Xaa-Pro aminopeptidase
VPDGPGTFGRFAGIGVRIEDDVLVTEGDPEVLSAGVPVEVGDVEALIGGGG